jgi:hypothetical protein
MNLKNLGVHSNLFAPPTRNFLTDIDRIHLKNANNTQYLTKFGYFVSPVEYFLHAGKIFVNMIEFLE